MACESSTYTLTETLKLGGMTSV